METISGLPKSDLTPRQTDVAYTGNRLTSIDTLWAIPPDYPATGASYAHDNAVLFPAGPGRAVVKSRHGRELRPRQRGQHRLRRP